jgi:hypothetical protein
VAEPAEHKGMSANSSNVFGLPAGEQSAVEDWSATADTFAGQVKVEWASEALVRLRYDAMKLMKPTLAGMKKVISEAAVRRGLTKLDETAGQAWLQTHLDYCMRPLRARQRCRMVHCAGCVNLSQSA